MIYQSTLEQVNKYRERAAVNQSSLKHILDRGMLSFIPQREALMTSPEETYEEKKHFIIGTGVDTKLTLLEGEFEKIHHVSQIAKKPGPKALTTLKIAFEMACRDFPLGPDVTLVNFKRHVHAAADEAEFFMNRRDDDYEKDNRINTIIKDNGQAYWLDLCLAVGKQILDDEEMYIIDVVSNSFKTHKYTAFLFNDSPGVDTICQFPLYFTYLGVDCKGMIDLLRIDHNKKRVMPIDIKTTWKYTAEFSKVLKERRYDIQAAFYTEGLVQCFDGISEMLGVDISGYSIANFAFVVESTIQTGCPLIFPLEGSLILQGRDGDSRYLQGFHHAMLKYIHWGKNNFSVDTTFDETNGIVLIDQNYSYPKYSAIL